MLGNPYASALSVTGPTGFITANSTQFDPNYVAVYLYDGASPGHARYYYIGNSTGWGDPISQTHVQVGQGFFVLAMNDYSTFTFNKGYAGAQYGCYIPEINGIKGSLAGIAAQGKIG